MNLTTLKKANDLNQKIREFGEALNCFEWQPYSDEERMNERISTNPRLIIDFDGGDGREQIALPMNLSDALVSFIKTEIKKGLEKYVKEFNDLKC